MPSKSKKQANFMAACAHGAGYDKCPPANVSKEFNQADKGTGILKKHAGHDPEKQSIGAIFDKRFRRKL